MKVHFGKIARTTEQIEKALRELDKVLDTHFNHARVEWKHREITSTKEFAGKFSLEGEDRFCSLTKWVKIVGFFDYGWTISAVIKFEGTEHHQPDSTYNCQWPAENYSITPQVTVINLEMSTPNGYKVKRTCQRRHDGNYTVS